jgi:hypothetical protein
MGSFGLVAVIFYILAAAMVAAGVVREDLRGILWGGAFFFLTFGLILSAANQVAGEIITSLTAIRDRLDGHVRKD